MSKMDIPFKKEDMPEEAQMLISEMEKAIDVLVAVYLFVSRGERALPNGTMENIAITKEGAVMVSVKKLSQEELDAYTAKNMHINVETGTDIKDDMFSRKHKA